jgi:hypothetical protein
VNFKRKWIPWCVRRQRERSLARQDAVWQTTVESYTLRLVVRIRSSGSASGGIGRSSRAGRSKHVIPMMPTSFGTYVFSFLKEAVSLSG